MGMYYDSYPNISEWYDRFVEYNTTNNGNLPADALTPQVIKVMNTVGSGLLMIAMGLATDMSILAETVKHPALTVIGVLAQYISMPLTGIILIYSMKMAPLEALATYLFALSPGGGTSNMMAYYLDLNLELSITLTSVCTIMAFGMMPAYLELLPYILEDYTDDAFDIPFVDLAQNLALIVGCLIIGFAVSWWKPEFSAKAARIISPITYLILFALVILNMVKYYPFGILTKNTLIVMIVIGPMGAAISYIITGSLSCLSPRALTVINCCSNKQVDMSPKILHTIAVEVGNQNAVVSQLIMMSAFINEEVTFEDQYTLGFVIMFPILMILFQQVEQIMIIVTYVVYSRITNKGVLPEESDLKEVKDKNYETSL